VNAGADPAWTRDLPTPSVALAIAAHPDDVEFNAAATLAKWSRAGCKVHHLILTDGSKGTWNQDEDIATLVKTREVEQRAAAAAIGATGEVVMFGEVDGELVAGRSERARLARWIRTLRPDVVLGHDPWKRYRLHPDHRNAGWLTVDAVVAARDPFFFPEQLGGADGLTHHRPDALLLFEADEPDHVEDVGGLEDAKVAALLEHRSQYLTTMEIDERGPDADRQRDAFRSLIHQRLRDAGEPIGVDFGEAFKLVQPL
jgi:LmbE family N-acetylglucosaminyl deacetylase